MNPNENGIPEEGMDMKIVIEKIRKLEAELLVIKRENATKQNAESSIQTMLQMVWQFGEKFGEMRLKMEQIEKEMAKMIEENVKIKEELNRMKTEMAEQNREMNEKIKTKMAENLDDFTKLNEAIGIMQGKIQQFEENNAELGNLTNGFAKLKADVEMHQIEFDKFNLLAMQLNKWNACDSAKNLAISENGLVVTHSGPTGKNSVRAILTVPKLNGKIKMPYISIYFEVEILSEARRSIDIGFCDDQFPLEEGSLGRINNSIGIWRKEGMYIDGSEKEFGIVKGFFKQGDVVGIGLIHSPLNSTMKCFATYNGDKIGLIELPEKFFDLQLFPAITLHQAGNSIHTNFGKEKWLFDPIQLIQ